MKKLIYALILPLVAISGLVVFANRTSKAETLKKPVAKPLCAAENDAEKKKWEASPDGVKFKNWEASPAGQKVTAGINKIRNQVNTSANMEAVVTSLSLPPGSRLGLGLMVRINEEDYILSFGLEESHEFEQLRSLKVNDKIIIKSHAVTRAPKYSYPIINGDYVERDSKVLYKRAPRKGGC